MKLRIFVSMLMLLAFTASCDDKTAGDAKEADTPTETTKAEGPQGIYKVDLAASKIAWTGTKVEDGEKDTHTGELRLKEGSLKLDEKGALVGGDFGVDMLSLVNTDGLPEQMKADFEKHLKSADFFEVDKYTTADFMITSVTAKEAAGAYSISGSLAVKDIVKNLTFDANIDRDGETLKGNSEVLLTNEDLGLAPFPAQIQLQVSLVAKK